MRSGPMIKYRPEIDGLRAISVLAVMLFHAAIPGFTGGFVGVDMFFVISGYLITSILIQELQAGTFSIASFYERRMRRIMPALFVVLLACLVAGWFIMSPYAYGQLGRDLMAVPGFVSNILFWRTTNYFTQGQENPLLHTWSLGIEEQFYIFLPLALMLIWRYAKNHVLALIMLAMLASLAVSEWAVATGRMYAAFY